MGQFQREYEDLKKKFLQSKTLIHVLQKQVSEQRSKINRLEVENKAEVRVIPPKIEEHGLIKEIEQSGVSPILMNKMKQVIWCLQQEKTENQRLKAMINSKFFNQ